MEERFLPWSVVLLIACLAVLQVESSGGGISVLA